MAKTLLLMSDWPEDGVFAAEAASVAGLPIHKVNSAVEAADFISKDEVAATLIDASTEELYQVFETAIQEKVGLFSEQVNANTIHFLSPLELHASKYLFQSPIFGHFVRRESKNPKEAGQHYGKIIKATFKDKAYGLSQFLKERAKVQFVKLSHSNQKVDAIEAVKAYCLAAKLQPRMANTVAGAVDELLMNAIYEAPIDEFGKQIHQRTPRSASLELTERSTVEMSVGFDGEHIAISVIDHWGSLDKGKLLSHLSKTYGKEDLKVKSALTGAGIELAAVFHSGGSFFFVSEFGVRSEITIIFRKTQDFREFRSQFRFISTQFYFQ